MQPVINETREQVDNGILNCANKKNMFFETVEFQVMKNLSCQLKPWVFRSSIGKQSDLQSSRFYPDTKKEQHIKTKNKKSVNFIEKTMTKQLKQ